MEQQGFLDWFHQHYPDVLCFHIPNGEYRMPRTAQRLKVAGVVRGIPDLYIPHWHLWIEVKSLEGKLSPSQVKIIGYLRSIGDTVIVGYGATDISVQVLEFLKDRK